jgi:hypothetical protein
MPSKKADSFDPGCCVARGLLRDPSSVCKGAFKNQQGPSLLLEINVFSIVSTY